VNSLLIVFAILLSTTPLSVRQQAAGDKREDIYRKIPEEQRGPLKQALDKLVEAEKAGDWKSVYASLDKQHVETEDNFVSKMKRGHTLLEFRPSKVTFMPPDGSWNIQGCASFEGDHTGRGRIGSVHARWADSQWHLSPVVMDLFGSEKKMTPRECSIPQAKPIGTMHGNGASASATYSPMLTMR
jgi:hypothetical protein